MLFTLVLCHRGFAFPPDSTKNVKIGVLPSLFYTPETRAGIGILGFSYFKTNKNDSLLRKSNTQTYLTYTQNKQFAFENDFQLWFLENKFFLSGSLDFSRFPQYFFGLGNRTMHEKRVTYSADLVKIQTKALAKIHKNFYAGIFFQYKTAYNFDMTLMSYEPNIPVHGDMGFMSTGIGPQFIIDKRDNPLNPSEGHYLEGSIVDYNHIFKNEFKFTSLNFDARKYHTFFNRLVWNGNAYFSFNKGNIPFSLMPEIGGARFLRGFYKGRFRDNNLIVVQHEFRMHVYKMFGLAIFGGVGSVANSVKMFKDNTIQYSFGTGIRIRINKKENTNLRIDYGFTKDSHGLYIVFAEAF